MCSIVKAHAEQVGTVVRRLYCIEWAVIKDGNSDSFFSAIQPLVCISRRKKCFVKGRDVELE